MLSYQFYGPKDIRLENIPNQDLNKGELRVKIHAALTGGTDTKTYLRGHPTLIKSIPSSFGYEFSGEVIESKSDKFQVGARVVCGNTIPCYKCFFCEKEEFELCENLEYLNGSFAEEIIIPEQIVSHNTYLVNDSTEYKFAAMTQTLAVTIHCIIKSQIKDNENLILIGLGPIGQCIVKLIKYYYPQTKIWALARSESKLKLAQSNGADYCINSSDFNEAKTKIFETLPYGGDIVIEAVGQVETWTQALELVRKGGLVNFFGGCPKGSKLELDTYQSHYEELRTIGTYHHSPVYIKQAIDLINSGAIDLSSLISAEYKLVDLKPALESMINGKNLKTLITP